jgi:NADH-quinone oxidoreductase subunit L
MTLPPVVLAVASLIGGFIGIEQFVGKQFGAVQAGPLFALFAPFVESPVASICGLGAVVLGLVVAFVFYSKAKTDPLPAKLQGVSTLLRNKFYFDEFYARLIASTQDALAGVLDWFDRWIVAGFMVRGVEGTTELVGRALRLAQTGSLQTYAFLFVTGIAVLLYFVLR